MLRRWFRILADTDGEFEKKYRKFMGDSPDGSPGHNRRMLAYFAGLPVDRQRLIVLHGWQIHDHMCNTERADSSEYDWRYGLFVVLMLSALGFAVDSKPIVVGAYVAGAIFFLLRPIWRKYLSRKND